MRRKIPGTDVLIAFETAARHLSFTRAAAELNLTQSAVCRQIAGLEQYLGVPMFNRIKKRISLTDAGQQYAKQIREHLARLERDTLSVMAHEGAGGVLELAVIPTFATRWLIPRLGEFNSLHPEITLNLTTRAEPFMFTDTPFDAAIHFGDPVWPGAVAEFLFGEEIVPVCSPKLLEKEKLPLDPHDLKRFTLLHQSARPDAWHQWFDMLHIADINAMRGPRYELFSMLVEAARAGLGVALVPRFFVLGELASGDLLVPCTHSMKSERGYYLVYPERKSTSAALQIFMQWLVDKAQRYRQATPCVAVMPGEEGEGGVEAGCGVVVAGR
ncbi:MULTISPECIES: transcriptional regulator GcvA [unclassified Paludibacterium]|uniref:transcriptional regulator GcvA n=1 Tax=unclassified Paludibacterium TaxID=2618429 RepID=UPI001C0589E2|nr:transcriptional regulator GcvA [Paludibacterium sp. B53371]BEV73723.1 LysR family transcriptional regulator [Paludibacterium sp. THUN1379]